MAGDRRGDGAAEGGHRDHARRRRSEKADRRPEHDEQLPVAAPDQSRGDEPHEEDGRGAAEHDAGESVDGQRTHHPVVERGDEAPRAGDDDDAGEHEFVRDPPGADVLDRCAEGDAADERQRQGNGGTGDPPADCAGDERHEGAQSNPTSHRRFRTADARSSARVRL